MMKSIFYLLLLSVVFYSCCDCPEQDTVITSAPEEKEDSLIGTFIRVADNARAGAKDSLFPIDGLTIKGSHAQFVYDGTPMSGTCEVDNGFVYINTASELGILGFEIMNQDRLEGEGFAHGSFARSGGVVMAQEKDNAVDPEPTENVAASTVQPQATTTNNTKNSNTTTNTQKTSTQKTSGSGGGPVFGSGTGSGAGDSGSGTATGSANGPTGVDTGEDSPIRTRLSDVNVSGVKSSTDETITLQIAIDGAGNVTKASVIKSKTTTKDDALINEVIAAVKKQVKYSRNTGASLKYEIYTVKVRAN